ncbi:DHH family phosphoesterase [Patescibacteria group bacterium]|nr:DHH family phosphoesterase [Patescibacteria group bacterium]
MAEIKNIKKAATRIKRAVKNQERIILYGDADLDGACSVVILKEAMASLGARPTALYFPDREAEGYGITRKGLKTLRSHAPALLVVMDLGISNFEEVKEAKKLGFEVVIVDHHEILNGKVPEASIVVDPKQPGDSYPFKTFAASGLTFRLAELLLGKLLSPSLRAALAELAALGTIADMMPREQDNLEIIQEGLATMERTWRPGLRALWEFPSIAELFSFENRVYRAISILNVRDVEDGVPGAFRLLAAPTEEEARELTTHLAAKNEVRQETIKALVDEAHERVKGRGGERVVFEGFSGVDYVLLGSAASVLSKDLDKPVFLYKEAPKECIGSARAPKGYNTVEAMASCAELLEDYGGHPPASGFRFKTKNTEKFGECLHKYFRSHKV